MYVYPHSVVHFRLKDRILPNNSAVLIHDIGDSLVCVANNSLNCCRGIDISGYRYIHGDREFILPNGTSAIGCHQNNLYYYYYQYRHNLCRLRSYKEISLNFLSSTDVYPAGYYKCSIADDNGTISSIGITLFYQSKIIATSRLPYRSSTFLTSKECIMDKNDWSHCVSTIRRLAILYL